MISDKKCHRFISFVGEVVSTGLPEIIKVMIKNNWFDVTITTCGALNYNIMKHFSNYNEGSFTMDDEQLSEYHTTNEEYSSSNRRSLSSD